MIDVKHEKVISLAEAAKALPPIDGKTCHVTTLWRWCRVGLHGRRLEHVRVGNRLCTSVEALSRFNDALARADRLNVQGSGETETAKGR